MQEPEKELDPRLLFFIWLCVAVPLLLWAASG